MLPKTWSDPLWVDPIGLKSGRVRTQDPGENDASGASAILATAWLLGVIFICQSVTYRYQTYLSFTHGTTWKIYIFTGK